MNVKTIIVLLIGTAVMLLPILFLMRRYQIALWKGVPVSFILTVTGTSGTYIWFFVECSWFGGRSYYGAVFLVPIGFWYVAKLVRVPYGDLMDLCAPAECVMLAIMKYQCLVDGCCGGMILRVLEDGSEVLFPSQIIEMINALLVMAILMYIAIGNKYRGKIYAWYLIIYGVTRFVLNWFREGNEPLLLALPAGNLWSLLAIGLGVLWLTDRKLKIVKNSPMAEQGHDRTLE